MARIPKKVIDRITKSAPRFQKILQAAKDRDVNESDTVTIVTDLLAEVFGYDKYSEITSELAIRGTFCDLAVKVGGEIKFLIEVKAIGLSLNSNHLRQAVGYGASEGIPWIVLTNGTNWEIYKIRFEQPISTELVCEFNLLDLSARNSGDQDKLFLLCKEGLSKDAIEDYHTKVSSLNRFVIAALIQSEPIIGVLRRELKKLAPGTKIADEEISEMFPDVLKRDVLDGEDAQRAQKQVKKAAAAQARQKKKLAPKPAQAEPTGGSAEGLDELPDREIT
ncbi:MAG: type I restriction enzyme HsdR N-terminal domain-containing protein [Bacteroidales bacterium]|nr:type I restriction enzyme HsdR N-terminal domain-containing protein [Candidatus Latescibacterota bacterium]